MFKWLQANGNVASLEMYRTFNCGVGMVIAVPSDNVEATLAQLKADGEEAFVVGQIAAADTDKPFVEMQNVEA